MGGKSKEIKRVFKAFQLVDYEREERWLSDMAAQGWRFVDTNGMKYTFERCEPEQVVYRIYCSGMTNDGENIKAMFRDYGWEYLLSVQAHSYFRRPAEGQSAEELDLFSDAETRLSVVRRMLTGKIALLVFLMLIIIVPNLLRFTGVVRKGSEGTGGVVMLVIYIVMLLLYLWYMAHAVIGYFRLKRKYQGSSGQ
ncbi:MAG: DUF2812 domain-containing protein [Oscillospiraceae bacterium]|nr:DUF2812 domain-containing protein [Oscillospiraceae bacterium]